MSAGATRPSGGGRPQQLYILTEQGKEMSPRQYSWLAQLVVASVQREEGVKNMGKRMNEISARHCAADTQPIPWPGDKSQDISLPCV